MEIVNCTPHPLVLIGERGEEMVIPASGILPRCRQEEVLAGEVNGYPVYHLAFGEVENLPEPKADTFFVVSAMVAQAKPERQDLLIPAHLVRDEQGRIVGCSGFARV